MSVWLIVSPSLKNTAHLELSSDISLFKIVFRSANKMNLKLYCYKGVCYLNKYDSLWLTSPFLNFRKKGEKKREREWELILNSIIGLLKNFVFIQM